MQKFTNYWFLILILLSSFNFAQNNDPLPEVWGKIKIQTPGTRLPTTLKNMKFSLSGGEYSYTIQESDEIKSALSGGIFKFFNVPVNTNMIFEISFNLLNGEVARYSASYQFQHPDLNLIQKAFRKAKAYEHAGNLGTFICHYPSGKILYENRYD